jgi:murein DD-endopeptidase MepM/ murein hydrolase activator NlpD
MLEERVRVMILSKNGTGYKQISLTWKKFCLLTSVVALLIIGIAATAVGVFTRLYHNYRIVRLENDRETLQKELLTIRQRVSSLNNRLAEVEILGDELRNVSNLPPLDSDVRQVGVGGPSAAFDYIYYTNEVDRSTTELKLDLEKFERAVLLEKASLAEIESRLVKRIDNINHFPSIRPILGGRVQSKFGWRTDPFTLKPAHHPGVDIPARTGTKVLCTADGTIEVVKNNYTPNKDYGRFVVVNHGGGYRTRYAHLSSIHVKKGQRVKKWEPIAEVGTTGRSEGPHLHYEVIYYNTKQDPENFIYN